MTPAKELLSIVRKINHFFHLQREKYFEISYDALSVAKNTVFDTF